MKQYNNGPRKAMMYGGMTKRKPMMYGGMATKKKKPRRRAMKKGGEAFPDLTGDGKVTQADILKGRGVKGFQEGGEAKKGSLFDENAYRRMQEIYERMLDSGAVKNVSEFYRYVAKNRSQLRRTLNQELPD